MKIPPTTGRACIPSLWMLSVTYESASGIAGRGLIQIVVDRRNDRLEVRLVVGQRGAPDRPVGLGQLRARIERHAIRLHCVL